MLLLAKYDDHVEVIIFLLRDSGNLFSYFDGNFLFHSNKPPLIFAQLGYFCNVS